MEIIIIIVVILFVIAFIVAMNQATTGLEYEINVLTKLKEMPNFTPVKTIIKQCNQRGLDNEALKTADRDNFKETLKESLKPLLLGLSLDDKSKQICLIKNENLTLIPFADVIEMQVILDGETVTKTNRLNQAVGMAVGATLGGGTGLLIGGLSASTTTNKKIKDVTLKVILNDLSNAIFEIDLRGKEVVPLV